MRDAPVPRAACGVGAAGPHRRLSVRIPFRLQRLQPNSGGTKRGVRAKLLCRSMLRGLARNGTILIGCVDCLYSVRHAVIPRRLMGVNWSQFSGDLTVITVSVIIGS